jgi:hypothetical protein
VQGGFGIYSLNLKKEFNEGKGSIGFGAENFLSSGMRRITELNTPTFSQSSTNVINNMNFKINFSYRIGKMMSDATSSRKKKSVNNDDLKGGGEGGMQDAGGAQGGGAPQGARPGGAPGQIPSQRPAGMPATAPAGAPATRTDSAATQPEQTQPADTTQQGGLTGRWQGMMGEREMILDLVANGTALTGSMQTPMGQVPISDGVISGDEFTFNLSMGPDTVPYKGKQEGDQLRLSADFLGQQMEGTLQRAQ